MQNRPLVAGLGVLAAVFLVLAVLYGVGAVNFGTSVAPHHYKHAIVLIVLAVAALVGANFARQRQAA